MPARAIITVLAGGESVEFGSIAAAGVESAELTVLNLNLVGDFLAARHHI